MERRIRMLALTLIPLFCLGLVNLSFSDDAIRLESWRQRPNEGNFAQGIAGVYLIRHLTDEGTTSAFRLISLTAEGNWASTHSGQHVHLRSCPIQRPTRGLGAVGLAGDYGGGDRFQPRPRYWSAYRYRARPLCSAIQQRFPVHHRHADGAGLSARSRPHLTLRRCRPYSLTRYSPDSGWWSGPSSIGVGIALLFADLWTTSQPHRTRPEQRGGGRFL